MVAVHRLVAAAAATTSGLPELAAAAPTLTMAATAAHALNVHGYCVRRLMLALTGVRGQQAPNRPKWSRMVVMSLRCRAAKAIMAVLASPGSFQARYRVSCR
ncbi:hypothetical protein [Roseomonas marmotae]|uniref:hypothetical protein n=1 Tax=Roseomonas marmotae TaxID=2768161 RepID=UPI0038D1BCB7